MDYKEKLKEALNSDNTDYEVVRWIEQNFPELKESEDERIRKSITEFFKNYSENGTWKAIPDVTKWIAWLEKQKTSEEALQYLRENHSSSEMSDFQAAMNIAVAKAYDKGYNNGLEKQGQIFTKKDIDDAYLKGVTNTKNEIEKQYEANYQIRKDIATFIFNYRGVIKDRAKWMDYLGIKFSFAKKQGEKKETLCDKCKKEQPSHSCQDITALGRCALEIQKEHRQDTNYPKFDFNDVLSLQCCMETVKKVQEDKDLYEKLKDLHGRIYDAYHFEKQGEQKPINEDAEKEKIEYVSGQFLYCKGSFNEFKEGESYWLEYIGNDTYVGRSDNILNKKFRITPRQLYTWLDTRHFEHSKQGEQNPVDKVEPKFKVDDWVVYCGKTCKITGLHNGIFTITNQDGSYFFNRVESTTEPVFHLWTIQDAKKGDVLCTYECCEPKIVFILKRTPKKHYALSYYCYYNIMYPHFDSDSEKGCLAPNDEDVKPATKEQRDTLLKAMTDARYTFDFEKKELKKIEQKPAWSKEDEKMIDNIIFELEENQENISGVGYKIDWLESLKDRVQPKVELTQLDKNILEAAIAFVEQNNHFNCWRGVDKHTVLSALYSLRPQSQWKPSDEQMEALEHFIIHHNGSTNYAKDLEELRLQLKKLREK